MLGVPYVSSREKLFPVKFMFGVPYFSSPWKTIPPWNLCLCPMCFFPVKNYPPWNLCLVSYMFLPREIYAWCPICFSAVYTTPSVVYACGWRVTSINASQLLEMYCYCFVSAADARSFSDSCVFIARQYTNVRKWYSNYVCLSVRLSVRFLYLTDWLTDWLYSHNKTLHINSDTENYNVQDRKE